MATDAQRLPRFQREAEVLAALNHPNIAQIYGIEKFQGTHALVMELVEPTLADRIAQSVRFHSRDSCLHEAMSRRQPTRAFGVTSEGNAHDVILFTPNGNSPLWRISASSGAPVEATTLDETSGDVQHALPYFLPDGRHCGWLAGGCSICGAAHCSLNNWTWPGWNVDEVAPPIALIVNWRPQ